MDREREGGGVGRREGRILKTEYSIFIENLPHNQNPFHLARFFSRFGRITDVYIPRKVAAKSRRRFGFVRFDSKEGALRAVRDTNGKILNQHRIFVAWAKFQKGERKKSRYHTTHQKDTQLRRNNFIQQRKIWVPKTKTKENTTVIRMSQEDLKETEAVFEVQGETCEEMEAWLKRSLVCYTDHPRDPSSLANTIMYEMPSCLRVTDMGLFKFILTFESEEEAELIHTEYKEFLLNWFQSVARWNELEACETRRTWIEITGIPGHAWSRENIKKIVQCWGELVCIDTTTEEATSFSVAKALIDTSQLSNINGQAILLVKEMGFRIFIREAKGAVWPYKLNPVVRKFNTSDSETEDEANSSQNMDQHSPERVSESILQEDEQPLVQNLNDQEDEESREEATSRTLTDNLLGEGPTVVRNIGNANEQAHQEAAAINEPHPENLDSEETIGNQQPVPMNHFGKGNQHIFGKNKGALVEELSINGGTDSDAALGVPKPSHPKANNATPLSSRKNLSTDNPINDILENHEESRKSQRSRKKKVKRLREKCKAIEKELNVCEEDVLEARHAWEVTKLAGLATKGDDEKVVQKIARNIALEKLDHGKYL